jgi:hypothetical protein
MRFFWAQMSIDDIVAIVGRPWILFPNGLYRAWLVTDLKLNSSGIHYLATGLWRTSPLRRISVLFLDF